MKSSAARCKERQESTFISPPVPAGAHRAPPPLRRGRRCVPHLDCCVASVSLLRMASYAAWHRLVSNLNPPLKLSRRGYSFPATRFYACRRSKASTCIKSLSSR